MIVIADLHMDKVSDSILFDGMSSQVLDIRNRLVEAVVAAAKDDRILVIAGDIFNKVNPPTYVIAEFFAFLDHCRELDIYVYIIPGNHDCGVNWANISMLREVDLPNVFIITDITRIAIFDFDVTFIPHLALRQLETIEADYGSLAELLDSMYPEGMDIVIGHGMVTGLKYDNDIFYEAGNALTIDVSAMPDFNLMVLGHVHNHCEMSGKIVYPGSPRVTNFGEVEDEKGYVQIHKDGSWKWFSYVDEVTPYKDITIDLVTKDDVDLSDEVLEELVAGAVIKLRVLARDRIQVDEPLLIRAFNKFGHVSRFEVNIDKQATGEAKDHARVAQEHPVDLLKTHLSKKKALAKVKQLAFKIGKEIVEEVLNA